MSAERVATGATTVARDPFSPGLQRAAAASGIAAALLLLLSVATNSSETPDFAAPAAEWLRYASEEDGALKLSSLLLLLAMVELLWFAGVLRSALGEAEVAARGFTRLSFIVLGGFVYAAACVGLGASTQAVLGGIGASGGEPEVAKVAGQLSGAFVGASTAGFAAALLAAALLVLRTRAMPRWLGVLAAISAAFFFLACFYLLGVDDDENIAGFGYFLGFMTLIVWLVGTSVTLVRRVGRRYAD